MSFTSRHGCECYKKLQTYGIPLHISDENEFLSEYSPVLSYENAFSLPGTLKINEDIKKYPIVEENDLSYVFQEMALVIPGLSDFDQNVLSFYILDLIIEGLWTVQNEKMSFYHQKVTLLWILYFFNYIQQQNPSRKNLFDHLKVVLFCKNKIIDLDERHGEMDKASKSEYSKLPSSNSELSVQKCWALPLPPDYDKNHKESFSSAVTSEENMTMSNVEEEEKSTESSFSKMKNLNQTEENVSHFKIILEVLYRIFARLWVYLEIQTVFHSMPPTEQVLLPFNLNTPKTLYKTEPLTLNKSLRRSTLEKSSDGIDIFDSYKNDFIFPLQMSEEAKCFLKILFPQNSQRSNLGKIKDEKNKK